MSNNRSSHFDTTDEYVARCGMRNWANTKSVELAERANRLQRQGKENAFTLRLRSFIIHSTSGTDLEMLRKVMFAWGAKGPFYDNAAKQEIKRLMGE